MVCGGLPFVDEPLSQDPGTVREERQGLLGSRSSGLCHHRLAKGWCYVWISPKCSRNFVLLIYGGPPVFVVAHLYDVRDQSQDLPRKPSTCELGGI
jgi:hypothetical protein